MPPQSVIDFSVKARQPDVKIRELAIIVDCEPALTTELLRNVNSCVRGLRHKVDSVTQAITLLGIPSSTTILLTSALSNAMSQVESMLLPTADFRRETVERSIFAREVAKVMGMDQTLAYTAAMLQDILLPSLTVRYRDKYQRYLKSREFDSLVGFEQLTFGWTHCELTAKTLLTWGFSEHLALRVLQHHDSPEQLLVGTDGTVSRSFPTACSALLMDMLRQSPDGVTRLVDLHAINSKFVLMDVAQSVDSAIRELSGNLSHPVSLIQRLQNEMLNQIEVRRHQSVAPGRQFGNYVIEERLRESSMGAIYKALHIRMRRPAAIKILLADRTNQNSIAQFEREVQLTSTLRHPNTVSIFDYGRTPDDLFYYAMELVEGMTLAEIVKTGGPMCDGRVLVLLKQICSSIAEAHQMQLIHRDIKPENIMLSKRTNWPDHITVLDFGLVIDAKSMTPGDSGNSRAVVGTPLYMSPEAAQGKEDICVRSDLYSIGAVAYFLLTGSPVFTGSTVIDVLHQHVRSTPLKPTEKLNVSIAPQLEELVMKCLRKLPAERHESVQQLLEELSTIVPVQPWSQEDGFNWWTGISDKDHLPRVSQVDHLSNTIVTADQFP
ncbi:protein kinase domain-containing protein [Planctomicrobium sp. SH668]|uniref:protein kinase domain-containing protein n=1 Tax=Planctomicrobium sp. SH668 TaxID=3448126 RepID=UPI003F5B5652